MEGPQAAHIAAILPVEHDECFVDVMCAADLDTQSPGHVSLEQWSAESAINACLVRNEQAGLKPLQKGRGKAPVYKFSPLKCEPKFARSGDFAPPSGGTSVMAKQCTRQVRRLESIKGMLAKHDTIPNVVIENDWSAACRAKGFIPDFQTWAERVLPAYPTLEIIETLLEKTKTRVNDLCNQDKKRNLERWSHELRGSWKNQGNSLAHKQSKPQSNPFLNKAKVQETIRAHRIRIVTKGPPMYQIDKQERHHLHHIAMPKDLHWYNQQKGIFVAPGHEDPAIEVQCQNLHFRESPTIWADGCTHICFLNGLLHSFQRSVRRHVGWIRHSLGGEMSTNSPPGGGSLSQNFAQKLKKAC